MTRSLRIRHLVRFTGYVRAFDTSRKRMAESFFSTLQRELLDEHRWTTRRQLALAAATRASAMSAPSTAKPASLPPLLRRDHHNQPVR